MALGCVPILGRIALSPENLSRGRRPTPGAEVAGLQNDAG